LAAEFYNRLDRLAPDHPAVLVRLAGLAHLNGDQEQAIALAELAYSVATGSGETSNALAFYPLLLSDLLLDAGRYDQALEQAEAGIEHSPTGIAYASLGRALAHSGRFADAIAAYEQALALQDDPGWNVAIGDLLTATGESEKAADHYESAIEVLVDADEAATGQSLAAIYSDLDINAEQALGLAERDLARRQSIDAYDTLAWALYRNGRIEEAREAIDIARATGAQDAPLIYHSAVIAAAQGDQPHAIAELNELLDRNPGFHPLHSRHAAELLVSLVG
ncbi:MAG: tetratricopeptide repeat protein, partial [Acidimicrobiia bacterium]|nr:tetratricopeptide repeat protein [Acidimicrobiia bacterium]